MSEQLSRGLRLGQRDLQRLGVAAGFGVAGGVIGFVISEGMMSSVSATTDGELRVHTGFWFALILLGIGAGIIGGNSLLNRVAPSVETILIGLGSLLVGGFFAGYVAQLVYASMVDPSQGVTFFNVRVPRAIGWSIAGGLGGLAVGLSFRSVKRMQNGLIGGAIGGLLGGLVFDSVGTESAARMIGVTIVSTLIGLLIGVIEAARTSAWLRVVSGELRNREFPLLDDVVSVGRARSNRVVLLGDSAVGEKHLEIRKIGQETSFSTAVGPVLHNGVQTSSGHLKHGDTLVIGRTEVRVEFRAQNPASPPGTPIPTSTGPSATTDSGSGSWSGPASPQQPSRIPPRNAPRPVIPVNRPD